MLKWLENFNNNYANAIQTILLIFSLIGNVILFFIANKKKNTTSSVKNIWFSISDKFRISAVHKYEKSNEDLSGYRHISQNSRSDQWKKLIEVRRKNIFWLYIVPVDPTDILEVVISRNGKEINKVIEFNKH